MLNALKRGVSNRRIGAVALRGWAGLCLASVLMSSVALPLHVLTAHTDAAHAACKETCGVGAVDTVQPGSSREHADADCLRCKQLQAGGHVLDVIAHAGPVAPLPCVSLPGASHCPVFRAASRLAPSRAPPIA